jgi:hypothetical protein
MGATIAARPCVTNLAWSAPEIGCREQYRDALTLGLRLLGAQTWAAIQAALVGQPALVDELEDQFGAAGPLVAAMVQLGRVSEQEIRVSARISQRAALTRALTRIPAEGLEMFGRGYACLVAEFGRRPARRELSAAIAKLLPSLPPPQPPAKFVGQVRVDVSRWIPHDLHAEVRQLVHSALATVDIEGPVQVKVRASRGSFLGVAFDGVPLMTSTRIYRLLGWMPVPGIGTGSVWRWLLRIHPKARWLMVLNFPARPERHQKRGLSERMTYTPEAPVIEVADWREELYAVAAHEAHHLGDLQDGRAADETLAEWHALHALEAHRAEVRRALAVAVTGPRRVA